jgi:outer membrane receptor for ferrienterochelin and colicin
MNRWSYEQEGKMHAQFGISFVQDDKQGGQKEYYKVAENRKPDFYNINIDARHYNAFLKSGFFLNDQGYKSLGIIASADRHEIYSNYGRNKYNGIQHTAYMNILYQSVFGNTNHKFTTGASFMFDNYSETLNDSLWERTEFVPGAFFQYTFSMPEKLSVILGLRADYNTIYGLFITPRIHLKYDFDDLFSLRASAGKGYRTPNVIAENIQVLATSRSIYVDGDISVEKAWNYGLNFTKEFLISENRRASIGLDFYHTGFINQLVVDFDKDPQEVHFYNLEGRSFSNSLQADFMIQPFNRFEITLAGRYNNVKRTINGVFRESPYVSKYKALTTLSYASKHNKWKFDVSAQYNGPQRLPSTASNPEMYRRENQSPGFFMLHAQITKKFKFLEIYAGAENLTSYTQQQPIISAEEPFGTYFDASMIWGPVMGRTFYAGIRLSIK